MVAERAPRDYGAMASRREMYRRLEMVLLVTLLGCPERMERVDAGALPAFARRHWNCQSNADCGAGLTCMRESGSPLLVCEIHCFPLQRTNNQGCPPGFQCVVVYHGPEFPVCKGPGEDL